MTDHVFYLADVLARTIRDDMRTESRYVRGHAQASAAIKDMVEMPDIKVDRIIHSVSANHGKLSNVLSREIPLLTEPGIWEAIVQAVTGAFAGAQAGDEGR